MKKGLSCWMSQRVAARAARTLLARTADFDKAGGLRVGALTHQGDGRDLVSLHLVNVPYDDAVHAGPLDIANAQLRFNHHDVAGYVLADDRPLILGRHAALQLFLDRGLADARSDCADAPALEDRVVAIQGERGGYVAAAFGCQILLRERCGIHLSRRRRGPS